MKPIWARAAWLLTVVTLTLAGCASKPTKAPVEDRSARAGSSAMPPAGPATPAEEATKPPPGAENAGKPGYYTVKPGDTLMRIALDSGQSWRDVAKWNGLENPNVIEVGQVLRVVPPTVAVAPAVPPPSAPAAAAAAALGGAVSTRPVAQPGRVDSRSLDAKPPAPVAAAASAPVERSASVGAAASGAASGAAEATPAAAAPADEDVVWVWPASGPVLAAFDEGRNKGLTIGGKAGDPVVAAGDGRVVYAGSSLRGYGNLVIVKHNNIFLSAYAHNQVLLVKEDQVVRRGQKIAEMGSTDAERVQLHFEIRRQGKPVDPSKLLPQR